MYWGAVMQPTKLNLKSPFSQDAILTVLWDVFFGSALSPEGHRKNISYPICEAEFDYKTIKITQEQMSISHLPRFGIKHVQIFCPVWTAFNASGGNWGWLVFSKSQATHLEGRRGIWNPSDFSLLFLSFFQYCKRHSCCQRYLCYKSHTGVNKMRFTWTSLNPKPALFPAFTQRRWKEGLPFRNAGCSFALRLWIKRVRRFKEKKENIKGTSVSCS